MMYLVVAGFVYLFALYVVAAMMAAESIVGSLVAAVCASALWIVSMCLLFKGMVDGGVFAAGVWQ